MDDRIDITPDFGRYSSAIGRHRTSLAIIGLVAALLGYLTTVGGSSQVSRYSVASFAEIGTDLGYVAPKRNIRDHARFLTSDDTENRVEASVPGASVQVTAIVGTDTIELTARGSSSNTQQAIEATIAELRTYRREAVEQATQQAIAVGMDLTANLTAQIALIDQRIATTAPEDPFTLVSGLERTDLIRQRTSIEQSISLLQAAPDAAAADVQHVGTDTTKVSALVRVPLVTLGALLLVSTVLAILAFFDKKVRRRADVARVLGRDATLADITSPKSVYEFDLLIASTERLLAETSDSVGLVGLGSFDVEQLVSEMGPHLPESDRSRVSAVRLDGSTIRQAIQPFDRVVLVVSVGQIVEADLESAAANVDQVTDRFAGVVLAGSS